MRQASSSTFAKLLLCAAPLVQAALDSEDETKPSCSLRDRSKMAHGEAG